jgi:acyl dehydratase
MTADDTTIDWDTVAAGDDLPTISQTATLATSVAYAGASGDLNPLHYDPEVAAEVSPTGGIIAHGMFSMGLASRVLTAWAGGPEHVLRLEARFTRPWPLGEECTIGGSVREVHDDRVVVTLWVRNADGKPLLRGQGVVVR